ncbi:MAG: hypothetical protein U0802_13135 [Candidatus Binatia bacterium]
MNNAIEKGATLLAFLPVGCTPGVSCTGRLRARSFSIENPSPIPSGSVLYTRRLAAETLLTVCHPLHRPRRDRVPRASRCRRRPASAARSRPRPARCRALYPWMCSRATRVGWTSSWGTEGANRLTTDLSLATPPIRGISTRVAASDVANATCSCRLVAAWQRLFGFIAVVESGLRRTPPAPRAVQLWGRRSG